VPAAASFNIVRRDTPAGSALDAASALVGFIGSIVGSH
jgi:hypothetical protein